MGIEAIYARQSIEKKESLSIEQQIERCRLKATNPDLCEVYQESKSGKSTLNRDEFNHMMEGIRAGRISKIIVYRLDRISRSLADFAKMWEELNAYNVQFVSCSEDFDTTTPMGEAMLKIAMVFAEMERKIIVQRVTDSYYALAKKGYNLGGYAPFGFTKVEHYIDGKKTKALEADPLYQDCVLNIFKMYAETDISIGKIALWLKDNNVKTKKGNNFTSSGVGRILRSPLYVKADERVYSYLKSKGATLNNDIEDYAGTNGCYIYAPLIERTPEELEKRQYKKKKNGRSLTDLSNAYITLAPHEGIIPASIWLECQYKLDNNKQVSCENSGKHTWMSGLMRCANCNTGVTVVNNNRGRNYINCYGRKKHECNGRTYAWKLEEIEELAEIQLMTRLKQWQDIQVKESSAEEPPEVSQLRIQVAKTEELITRVEEEILFATSEQIKNRWRQKQAELQSQIDEANSKISKLIYDNNVKNRSINKDIDIKYIIKNWKTLEMTQQKKVANALIDFIIVGDIKDDGVSVFFK